MKGKEVSQPFPNKYSYKKDINTLNDNNIITKEGKKKYNGVNGYVCSDTF